LDNGIHQWAAARYSRPARHAPPAMAPPTITWASLLNLCQQRQAVSLVEQAAFAGPYFGSFYCWLLNTMGR
ncbi:MAG: hypothetical protein JXA33_20695, partial [Anaerolineae bacterium]|nr:hypothetical protein [Anaerolineae bacterium]